jgi:hypothetical protein
MIQKRFTDASSMGRNLKILTPQELHVAADMGMKAVCLLVREGPMRSDAEALQAENRSHCHTLAFLHSGHAI